MRIPFVIRWIARIWSIASLAFIAAFAIGEGGASSFPTAIEAIGLLLFPIGVAAGMVLAWRWEGIGGAITTLSLVAFYLWLTIVGGRLPRGPYFLLVAAPGFLFLFCWLVDRFCPLQGTRNTAFRRA